MADDQPVHASHPQPPLPPEIVTDPDTAADLLAEMITANPAVTRFSGFGLDADGRPDRHRLDQALQHGFAVIRWHLEPSHP